MKSFLIIGMGTFGHHLCQALCRNKCEIMIVDQNAEAVEVSGDWRYFEELSQCVMWEG